jgi:rhamnose utilization protein RhaD (predicted bifunctional aldolase and dehydrogenase)
MQSLWDDAEASRFRGDLGLRVYTSRLLGRDRSLVLHGGGNTSVKVRQADLFGEEQDVLYVKGSGWDLERIEEAGFAPLLLAGGARRERLAPAWRRRGRPSAWCCSSTASSRSATRRASPTSG